MARLLSRLSITLVVAFVGCLWALLLVGRSPEAIAGVLGVTIVVGFLIRNRQATWVSRVLVALAIVALAVLVITAIVVTLLLTSPPL